MDKQKIKFDMIYNNPFDESYDLPEFKKVRNKKWIPYGISTNEFARSLIEGVQNSELHGSIISTKAKMITGEEVLIPNDKNTKLFLNNINPYDKIEELIYKLAWDLEVFGSYCLNIIWNKKHDRIVELYHTDASRVLYGCKNEKGFTDTYYYSNDWSRYRQAEYTPIEIPAYGTTKTGSELLVTIPSYQAGFDYYTYPDYIAAWRSIQTDIKIVEFHKNNLDNNFQPGKVVTFIGDTPTEEEQQAIREMFEIKQTGSANAGRTVINYALKKENAPQIDLVGQDGNDKMFMELSNDIRSRILTGHGVTSPMLVGITTPGQLGGSNELDVAKENFYRYRILPKRANILKTINNLLRKNGLQPIGIIDNEDKDLKNNDNE